MHGCFKAVACLKEGDMGAAPHETTEVCVGEETGADVGRGVGACRARHTITS